MSLGNRLHWHACQDCGTTLECRRHVHHETRCSDCFAQHVRLVLTHEEVFAHAR